MKKLSILLAILLTTSATSFAGEKDQDKNQDRDVLILTDKDKVTDPDLIKQLNAMVEQDGGQKSRAPKGIEECQPFHLYTSSIFNTFQSAASISKLKPHCLEYADIHMGNGYDSLVEFIDYSVAETFFAYQYEFVSGPSSCETDGTFADPTWFYGNSAYTGNVSLELENPLTMMVNENCHYQLRLITARQNTDGTTTMGGYSNYMEIFNNF